MASKKSTATAAKTTSKKAKPAAPALSITETERDLTGRGALPFVQCDRRNGVISPAQVAELKAQLLAAGMESLELGLNEDMDDDREDEALDQVSGEWEADGSLRTWRPQDSPLVGAGWVLIAVLEIEVSESTPDAVAVFARKPGDGAAWPFPKGKEGESGAEVVSEPVLGDVTLSDGTPATIIANPAMTKTEAHLARKSASFELLDRTDAQLKTFTPRVERHGEDEVSAASLGLQISAPNTILDLLSPSLRQTLYAAPEGQTTLPGVEESTPLLRTKVIETLKLNNCYEGWTLKIYVGIDDEDPFVIGDAKVDKFVVTPRDGGSVLLDLRVGSSDIAQEEAGWLYGKLHQDIEITLHAPVPKADAIDGTQGHPGASAPLDDRDAGDLFTAAHGRDGEGAQQQPGDEADDPDGTGPREPAEETS